MLETFWPQGGWFRSIQTGSIKPELTIHAWGVSGELPLILNLVYFIAQVYKF